MSGIAGLWNVPGDNHELNTWSFIHAANHRDLIVSVFQQADVVLPEYVLDPVPLHDMGAWIYQHQRMHADLNEILGISGLNLVNLNWQDAGARAGWIQANAIMHREAADILGIE